MLFPATTGSGVPDFATAMSAPVGTPATSVVALAELLAGLGSGTALEALAVFVMTVPPDVPGLTCTTKPKFPTPPEARFGIVQLIAPDPPTGGVVHVQPGAGTIDWNVVFAGMLSVRTALVPSSGPEFVTISE